MIYSQLQFDLKGPDCRRAMLFFKIWQKCHFLLVAASAGLLPCRSKVKNNRKLKGRLMCLFLAIYWKYCDDRLQCFIFHIILYTKIKKDFLFNEWLIDLLLNAIIIWICFLNQIRCFFLFVSPYCCLLLLFYSMASYLENIKCLNNEKQFIYKTFICGITIRRKLFTK